MSRPNARSLELARREESADWNFGSPSGGWGRSNRAIMELIFLGTGTSHGIPMIGCQCAVCLSDNPKNKRTRTSLLISHAGRNILIDAGIDLRQQALREKLDRLDAILFTHTHADHVFGLDEVRRFNVLGNPVIPVYGASKALADIRRIYPYIFNAPKVHGGIPSIELIEIDGLFEVCGLRFQPIVIQHGARQILGFRFGKVAYLTDCSGIPEASEALLKGLDLLILDALREKPHPTHFNLEEASRTAHRLGARRALFVHMSHGLEHEAANAKLPSHMRLAYDGLRVRLD